MSKELLNSLVGSWEGTCRTWFEPGKLADESKITAKIRPLLGGRFFRHEYEATIQGRPRKGEETLAFNAVTKKFQSAWVDDFHMNYAILFSEGVATDSGFVMTGKVRRRSARSALGLENRIRAPRRRSAHDHSLQRHPRWAGSESRGNEVPTLATVIDDAKPTAGRSSLHVPRLGSE